MNLNPQQIANLSAEEKRALLAQLLQKKASSPAIYPLSHNQRAMWFLHQLAPESSAYNVVFTARVLSQVDAAALKRAFQALINRHPALRTRFIIQDGEPVQEVQSYQEISFEEIDSSKWTEEELNQQVVSTQKYPFNLEHGPIFRTHLFRQSATDHILMFVTHHIVFDGWSAWLLLDEFKTLYVAERNGTKANLPPIETKYSDYVQWQAQMLAGPEGERSGQYWSQQLAGELPVLNLPTDRPRPPVQTFQGATHSFSFTPELTERIKELGKAEGATMYMSLLAAFQILLYRYSGQEDILVGSPMSGRSRPEFSGVVGDFINMVVLRANLSENPSFREFLGRVRQTVLEALNHQDYPFSFLVEQLAPNRDPSRSPLFQVSFVLQRPHRFEEITKLLVMGNQKSQLDFGGLMLEGFNFTQQEGQLDLGMEVTEIGGSLFGNLKYNTDLFEAATIVRLQQHFQTLLEGIVSDPNQKTSNLPLLTGLEQQQLLFELNNTRLDYPQDRCLHHLFEAQVARTPGDIAVRFENKTLTYRELNKRANQLAHYLQTLGVGPDTLVGICLERSLEMVVSLLGVLKAGGAYVPLDPAFPADRLAFMLSDSEAAVLLTQQTLSELISPPAQGQVVYLDRDWTLIERYSSDTPVSPVQPSHLAYVIYTSGSTGKPKGVQIPHQAVVNFLISMQQTPGLARQDILLSVTTLSFDIAALEIFLPLVTGAHLVLVSREVSADGPRLMSQLAQSGATVMQATPTTWRLLIESGWEGDAHLKVLCGGEALPRDLADQILERCGALWNMYGPTETTIWSTVYQLKPGEKGVPIGRPIGNTQLYILNNDLQLVPVGIPGELYIGGDGLARGYLKRPELTQERFVPHPFNPGARLYKTGDLVSYLPDGNVEFLGRLDHQVKVRGFRIELGEIEAALRQHPAVREAVVIVREDTPGDKRLVAYLLADQEELPATRELRNFVRESLPEYMAPAAFLFLEAYPLTPNKKIDRKALPAPDRTKLEPGEAFVVPSTPMEQLLAEVWQEVLGIEQISVYDNFFDLGGHSLLSVKVMAKLEQETGLKLPLAYIGHQTLGQLAALYDVQLHPQTARTTQSGTNGKDQGSTTQVVSLEPDELETSRLPSLTLEPFYFGPSEKYLFGCYHAPHAGRVKDCAVVLCYPMGHEYIRVHRAYQQLATRLARAGFPVLRFDFLGCGDSAGEVEEGQLEQWLADIASAVEEVKKRSGLSQVCLIGLRLGASLAMLAGTGRTDISNLVLWEPIIEGRRYLEELGLQQQKTLWRFLVKPKVATNTTERPTELLGFPISDTLFNGLEALNLLTVQPRTHQNILIIEGGEVVTAAPLNDHLRQWESGVTHKHLPSFEVWLENPDKALVPTPTLQAIISWLSEVC
jgi:amino acid adenylation domain-containing protein